MAFISLWQSDDTLNVVRGLHSKNPYADAVPVITDIVYLLNAVVRWVM